MRKNRAIVFPLILTDLVLIFYIRSLQNGVCIYDLLRLKDAFVSCSRQRLSNPETKKSYQEPGGKRSRWSISIRISECVWAFWSRNDLKRTDFFSAIFTHVSSVLSRFLKARSRYSIYIFEERNIASIRIEVLRDCDYVNFSRLSPCSLTTFSTNRLTTLHDW